MFWQCPEVLPIETMAPAAVEVDLWGDAGTAACELQTGWRGETGQTSNNACNKQPHRYKTKENVPYNDKKSSPNTD